MVSDAAERGLILVDTKYEFGVLAVDRVNTLLAGQRRAGTTDR
ncbi:MAG: phosphoribosylaminoimidazolesuccinocarboxamide synthase [Acidimicrobiales bacterium]